MVVKSSPYLIKNKKDIEYSILLPKNFSKQIINQSSSLQKSSTDTLRFFKIDL